MGHRPVGAGVGSGTCFSLSPAGDLHGICCECSVHGRSLFTREFNYTMIKNHQKGLVALLVAGACSASLLAEDAEKPKLTLDEMKGAALLKGMGLPAALTITGVVLLTGVLNLFIGSASAKWALLAPILVPMLMELGISPDLAQAAYRVGDSTTNIITPLMPYFPLVVVYCQRYMKDSGIGTVTALMLPYSVVFITLWCAFLLLYWALGLPLGLQSSYLY